MVTDAINEVYNGIIDDPGAGIRSGTENTDSREISAADDEIVFYEGIVVGETDIRIIKKPAVLDL